MVLLLLLLLLFGVGIKLQFFNQNYGAYPRNQFVTLKINLGIFPSVFE